MPRKPNGLHKEDIKSRIRKKGTSLTALSKSWGYQRNAISVCLDRAWPKVQGLVANYIGVEAANIWPDRYHKDGTARQGHRSNNNTHSAANRNSEVKSAA